MIHIQRCGTFVLGRENCIKQTASASSRPKTKIPHFCSHHFSQPTFPFIFIRSLLQAASRKMMDKPFILLQMSKKKENTKQVDNLTRRSSFLPSFFLLLLLLLLYLKCVSIQEMCKKKPKREKKSRCIFCRYTNQSYFYWMDI